MTLFKKLKLKKCFDILDPTAVSCRYDGGYQVKKPSDGDVFNSYRRKILPYLTELVLNLSKWDDIVRDTVKGTDKSAFPRQREKYKAIIQQKLVSESQGYLEMRKEKLKQKNFTSERGLSKNFKIICHFVMTLFQFAEGHEEYSKYFNIDNYEVEQHSVWNFHLGDIYCPNFIDEHFLIPINNAVDYMVEVYHNCFYGEKERKIAPFRQKCSIVLRYTMLMEMLQSFRKFGPNPKLKATKQSQPVIDLMK